MKRFCFSKFRVASEECLLWKPSGAEKGFGKELSWVRAAVCNPRARACNTQQTSDLQGLLVPPLHELWSHWWGAKQLQLSVLLPRGAAASSRRWSQRLSHRKGKTGAGQAAWRTRWSQPITNADNNLSQPSPWQWILFCLIGGRGRGSGLLFTYPTWVLFSNKMPDGQRFWFRWTAHLAGSGWQFSDFKSKHQLRSKKT